MHTKSGMCVIPVPYDNSMAAWHLQFAVGNAGARWSIWQHLATALSGWWMLTWTESQSLLSFLHRP